MAHPGSRKGDLMCWRRIRGGPWALGLVVSVGADVEVRELGKSTTELAAYGDRLLICRSITDLPGLRRRYKALSEPLRTREAVRDFVLPHVPPSLAKRT